MPGFDGAAAVERLDWKFSTDAAGVIPEPSTTQVGAFFDQLHVILDRPGDEKPSETVAYLASLSHDQMMLADEKLLAAYAALCTDSPSIEQLTALPHRERQAFFGWVIGQLLDPTSPTRVTSS